MYNSGKSCSVLYECSEHAAASYRGLEYQIRKELDEVIMFARRAAHSNTETSRIEQAEKHNRESASAIEADDVSFFA